MLYQNPAIQSRVAVHLVEEAKGGPSKLLLSFLFFYSIHIICLLTATGQTGKPIPMVAGSNEESAFLGSH
jgi:hypothetical protein